MRTMGRKPKIDGVQYRYIEDLAVALQAYKNNEVDVMVPDPNDVPTIKSDAVLGKEYKEYAGACTLHGSFALDKKPFDNKKVRQAFATGFDREGYNRDALKDTAVKTLTWIRRATLATTPESASTITPIRPSSCWPSRLPERRGAARDQVHLQQQQPGQPARAEYLVQMYKTSLGVDITLDPLESKALVAARKSRETYPQMLR